jgi:hypothetical protein
MIVHTLGGILHKLTGTITISAMVTFRLTCIHLPLM